MKLLFSNRKLYITITIIVIVLVTIMLIKVSHQKAPELITSTAETGSVRQLVSVSGIAKAKQIANLTFPTSGIIQEILVEVGDEVKAGDVLATMDTQTLYADRQEAVAALAGAIANRDELLAGPTESARASTAEIVTSKQIALNTTKDNETQKIINAYRTLLSTDLIIYSKDPSEKAVPPTLTGTYTCNQEGMYKLEAYSSSAESGYSYRLSGIEDGTYEASTLQPTPLGNCGLKIKFAADSSYNRSVWYIDVPNTKSSSYINNLNNYNLAKIQAENAISLAEQALTQATTESVNLNAPARAEALTRANANITQARARLSRIDALIADRALKAPFAGVVTNVNINEGEAITNSPVVTILTNGAFEVIARIPEIDIEKLQNNQAVDMIFDAKNNEIITGYISFISPQADEIDGVSYYEAIINFNNTPDWMRSGLNADVDIIINEERSSIRIPKRFLTKTNTGYIIMRLINGSIASTSVDVILEGNDGYTAISGINNGDIIVAP